MLFFTRLLLVTLMSGSCIPQNNQEEYILLTSKSMAATEDTLLQQLNVLEDKLLAQHELLEDKLLAQHEKIENLKRSAGRCSTKRQLSPILDFLTTDECERNTSNCSIYATCRDSPVHFKCSCMVGYSGDGVICEDIDECKDDSNVCGGFKEVCINYPGHYTCSCQKGYEKQGDRCLDINECKDSNICGDNEHCIDYNGHYECICQRGYEKQEDKCLDIDECKDESNDCRDEAVCSNLPGHYTCICPDGYEYQQRRCQDIDECYLETNCSVHAICTNIPGGYTCKCRPGREGDGYSCWPIGFVCNSPRLELQPFGCIEFVEEEMSWSDAQANCKAGGGTLLYGFTKQQLFTIVQHIHQHFDVRSDGWYRTPWVGVKGGAFGRFLSGDDGPRGEWRVSAFIDRNVWEEGHVRDRTHCGNVDLDPAAPALWGDDCSYRYSSLCQIPGP